MTLAVIGSGFGRTGTMSLKQALEQLGFGPCHHMEEVLGNPAQLPYWQTLANGGRVDWDTVFAGYRSTVDWPSCHFWRELADAYPDAKVVHSVRPEGDWWRSFSATIGTLITSRQSLPDGHGSAVLEMGTQLIVDQTFHAAETDEAAALAAYRQRYDDVRSALPANRLLVFDVAEGWGPLCAFLGVSVPDALFPRANSTDEFWRLVRGEMH
jgi:hypothetical protein